jgi:polyhydroxyalkanoate synthesis repressor PhaR
MESQRIIKRYKNRKLYDTQDSKYITLDEIVTLVKSGVSIQVMDHANSDITGAVLFRAISNVEAPFITNEAIEMYGRVLRQEGSLTNFVKRFVTKEGDIYE